MSQPLLSVIIPVHNEQSRLPANFARLHHYLRTRDYPSEIILVENGSLDETWYICQLLQEVYHDVRAFQLPERGKGAAVTHGMLLAAGDWRMMCDIDFSMPVDDIGKFMALRDKADVLIASREIPGSLRWGEPPNRRLMSRLFSAYVRWLALPGCSDSQCGFKLFSAKAANAIFNRVTLPGMSFDVQALFLAARLGYTVAEVPIFWRFDPDSRVRLVKDTWGMFWDVLGMRRAWRDSPNVSNPGTVTGSRSQM